MDTEPIITIAMHSLLGNMLVNKQKNRQSTARESCSSTKGSFVQYVNVTQVTFILKTT